MWFIRYSDWQIWLSQRIFMFFSRFGKGNTQESSIFKEKQDFWEGKVSEKHVFSESQVIVKKTENSPEKAFKSIGRRTSPICEKFEETARKLRRMYCDLRRERLSWLFSKISEELEYRSCANTSRKSKKNRKIRRIFIFFADFGFLRFFYFFSFFSFFALFLKKALFEKNAEFEKNSVFEKNAEFAIFLDVKKLKIKLNNILFF